MNDRIDVLTDISDTKTHFIGIDAEFTLMNDILTDIEGLLTDKSRWAGETRDKCENANNLVQQYERAIRPIIEELGTCLDNLTEMVGQFAAYSRNVLKIRSIP